MLDRLVCRYDPSNVLDSTHHSYHRHNPRKYIYIFATFIYFFRYFLPPGAHAGIHLHATAVGARHHSAHSKCMQVTSYSLFVVLSYMLICFYIFGMYSSGIYTCWYAFYNIHVSVYLYTFVSAYYV